MKDNFCMFLFVIAAFTSATTFIVCSSISGGYLTIEHASASVMSGK